MSTSRSRIKDVYLPEKMHSFIQELQGIAKTRRLHVSFLSGDVQCAAVGVLKTFTGGKGADLPPATDFRYISVVTSAIVNTP